MKRLRDWVTARAARLVDSERPANGPPPSQLPAFFRWCISGAWGAIGLAAIGYAIGGLSEALTMALLGHLIDATAGGVEGFWASNAPFFVFAVLFLVVFRPISFGFASAMQSIAVAPNLFNQTMMRLNRHMLGQSVSYFDDDFAGRLAQKQMQTARAVTDVVSETVNAMVFAFSTVIGMLTLGGLVSPGMALIVTGWLAVYFVLLWYFLPRIRTLSTERAARRAMVTGQVVDSVTNIKTVKLFAHDDFEDRATLATAMSYRDAALGWAGLAVQFRFSLILLAGLLPVMMLGYGLMLWSNGAATAGELAAVGAMAIRLSQMTGWVSWTMMNIYAAIGEAEDGMNTLSPGHGLTDAPDATALPRAGKIEFDAVSFAYGRQVGGVDGVSLTIQPGEKLGIVGASGAGKSTLVALLLRLYDVEDGAVRIGGQDLRTVTQESLRQKIGMVTQETAMFNRSARDNLSYGRPDASEDEILAATRQARAHEFITELTDFRGRTGYDAHLGERGVKLSGGQRQRIALARAILKDAPILVLDEATSALDSEVEAEIQAALNEVMEGKTVLAIAHRLSTIARMDRIVVMDQGRIVEDGTHEDLLAAGGLYARYWQRQSGGFIGLTEAAE